MKKVILSAVIVMFGLFLFSSCDLNEEQVKELEKYGYSIENQTKTGKDEIGGDQTEEDNDIELDTAGN